MGMGMAIYAFLWIACKLNRYGMSGHHVKKSAQLNMTSKE